MDTRKELIELILSTMPPCYSDVFATQIAAHLIANGVTIQKWYSASTAPKDGLYIVKLSNNQKVHARYNCGSWIMCEGYKDITSQVVSWMEIPE